MFDIQYFQNKLVILKVALFKHNFWYEKIFKKIIMYVIYLFKLMRDKINNLDCLTFKISQMPKILHIKLFKCDDFIMNIINKCILPSIKNEYNI